MAKNVLILSGSPRKNGNSDILCDELLKGAKDEGHNVVKIRIAEKHVECCRACYYCTVIVLSSPVYFYSICAQLKAVIDRTVAKWLEIKNKEFYYIMTAAENGVHTMDCTLECFRGFAACLEGSVEMGVIKAGGVYEKGEVNQSSFLKTAYEMGKNI